MVTQSNISMDSINYVDTLEEDQNELGTKIAANSRESSRSINALLLNSMIKRPSSNNSADQHEMNLPRLTIMLSQELVT